MKKYLVISVIIIVCFCILIINLFKIKPSGYIYCIDNRNSNGIDIKTEYKIYYDNMYVTKLISKEEVNCDDDEVLIEYRDILKEKYSLYNDVKYYDNSVKLKNNTLTSITEINYKKIDTKKLISIDSANRSIIKNDKVYIKDIYKIYKNSGAKCKYK